MYIPVSVMGQTATLYCLSAEGVKLRINPTSWTHVEKSEKHYIISVSFEIIIFYEFFLYDQWSHV